jgi:hypothetical protein
MKKFSGFLALLASLIAFACSNAPRSGAGDFDELATSRPTASTIKKVAWLVRTPVRDNADVASIVSSVAPSLGLKATAEVIVQDVSQEASRRVEMRVANGDEMFAVYESARDSIEVFTHVGNRGVEPASPISPSGARVKFAQIYDALEDKGVVSSDRVSREDVELHEVGAAQGDRDGLHRTWVDEYAFFAPVKLGGVELGTPTSRYGIWASIHRSGKIRRIELIGTAFLSSSGGNAVASDQVTEVDIQPTPDVDAFVLSVVGVARIEPLGVRLLVPSNLSDLDEKIEPHRLFQAIPRIVFPETGEVGNGKAYSISYSLVDAGGKLNIFPKPLDYGPNPKSEVKKP